MDVEIGGGSEALDERNGTGVGFGAFKSRLLDQKRRNDPVDDLQGRREQLAVAKGERETAAAAGAARSCSWRFGVRENQLHEFIVSAAEMMPARRRERVDVPGGGISSAGLSCPSFAFDMKTP